MSDISAKSNVTENLTVIVTIYKVEKYLKRCLESIRTQDYDNFVVLLIIGKGDIACKRICDEYAENDRRFRVIELEANGLSDARNVGILNTGTEFLTFIDGDDYLNKGSLRILMKLIVDNGCDISVGNYSIDDGNNVKNAKGLYRNGNYTGKEAIRMFLKGHGIQFVVAWGKIYRSSLFKRNNIQYPVKKLHEDNLTTYKLFYHAKNIVYTNEVIYCYVKRGDSLSYNTDIKKESIIIKDLPTLEEYANTYPDLAEDYIAYQVGVLISYMLRLSRVKENYYDEYLRYVEKLKRISVWDNKAIRLRMKILCFFVKTSPGLIYKILHYGRA